MAGRRRPATRRTEFVEPVGDLSARQTRRSTRRQEASVEPGPRPQAEIPQRGTRRRRRRSVESVATSDFLKNSAGYVSPEPENLSLAPVPESVGSQSGAVSETDDTNESPEMEVARIQDMVDFDIPRLTRWADKLYGTLSSINYSQPSVDDRSRLNSYRKLYNRARLPFADNSTFFINPISPSQEYDPEVRTKIQVAICSANIVSLLAFIMDVKLGEKQLLPTLEQLDDGFPALFDAHLQADDVNTARYLDLAFCIRCLRLVEALASDSSIEPFELAASIFCTRPGLDLSTTREALNKGPYKELAGIDINQNDAFYDIYRARIIGLISKLSDDRFQVLTILSQHCPQDRILNDLKSWASELYQLLNGPMDRGNIWHRSIAPKKHTRLGREDSEPLFVDDNARNEEDSDSTSDIDPGGYDRLLPQESNQSFIDSPATLAAVRQSEKNAAACSVTTPPSNQQAISRKGKASDTRDAIRRLEPKHILDGTTKLLQPNTDSGNEKDDDDDFEVNEQLRIESKRALEDESVQRPSPKRPRYSKQPQILSPRVTRSRELTTQRSLDGSQEDSHLQDRDILVLSQGARNIRRANYANKPRQVRVPWSASETSRLLELIADPSLNCSWSAMEKKGGFEKKRNQQALRDKARGLKVWYLEGDRVLPAGFDQVALGQKEKDAVIRCGRNPDRRENDLDEDGQVTNNIWVGHWFIVDVFGRMTLEKAQG
ncbi:hypothetical protein M434DRAFT_37773 [Hypoxylon sp. CO27-5]|nr:hypothetical protein M434DRAFT_37773 [Hypoxylon sp. CO27-5]